MPSGGLKCRTAQALGRRRGLAGLRGASGFRGKRSPAMELSAPAVRAEGPGVSEGVEGA